MNAGVPGYTSFETLIDLDAREADFAPDIVIVYQGFDDLRAATRAQDRVAGDNTHYRRLWTPPGGDSNGVLTHSRVALLSRWLFTKFRSRTSDLSEYVVVEAHAPQFVRPVGEVALASYRRNLTQTVAVARAAGARVLLVTQAYGEATVSADEIEIVDGGMSAFAQTARDVVQRFDKPATALLDGRRILPAFEGVFAEIDHLSDHGARVLGALAAEKVSALGWVPRSATGSAVGSPVPTALDRSQAPVMESEQARQLAALGYAAGSRHPGQGDTADTAAVVRTGKAQEGLNFYVSGHGPEAVLMDMDGNPVHRWRFEYERAFPNTHLPTTPVGGGFWRRALLLPDGDVIAIFEGQGLIRIDYRSRLRWAAPIGAHHDLFRASDGQVWVLTRKVQRIPQINADQPVLEDFVSVVNGEGKVVRKISILEAFWRSPYKALLDAAPRSGDLLHTNTVVRLTGEPPPARSGVPGGKLLLSLPRLMRWRSSTCAQRDRLNAGGPVPLPAHSPPSSPRAGSCSWTINGGPANPARSRSTPSRKRSCGNTEGHRSFLSIRSTTGPPTGSTTATRSWWNRMPAARSRSTGRGQVVWEFRSPHRTQDGLVAALDLKRIDPPASTPRRWRQAR